MTEIKTTDVLVIGDGLAGLRAAAAASSEGAAVTVVSKGTGASREIMGFNAVFDERDSAEDYYGDILKSGEGINHPELARALAENAMGEADFLRSHGMAFDRNPDGSFNTMLALGCRFPRLLHEGSHTGAGAMRIMRRICAENRVSFDGPVMIMDLIRHEVRAAGAAGIDLKTGGFVIYMAKAVIIASGGCASIHPVSTYPSGISGDGYAMAYRAGAQLIDMEFQQFEPCCFVHPQGLAGALAVTTLLSEGGRLRNGRGECFLESDGMPGYRLQKSELAKYIMREVREGRGTEHGGVYYDVTAAPEKRVAVDHEIFYRPALRCGIDLLKQYAEVAPAAHTCLGGIRINGRCETSIPGLFAAGEAAGGVHGANRIGGCAGAETLVFGAVAGRSAADFSCYLAGEFSGRERGEMQRRCLSDMTSRMKRRKSPASSEKVRQRLSLAAEKYLGLFRSGQGLQSAEREFSDLAGELEAVRAQTTGELASLYECENMLHTAQMQAKASLRRKESRGVFFREDYSEKDDRNFLKNILILQKDGVMEAHAVDCPQQETAGGVSPRVEDTLI